MAIQFTPPPVPTKILTKYYDSIDQEKIYIDKCSNFIFVCGGNSHASCREVFLNFANRQMKEYYFFKAENIFKTIELKKNDLLSIENEIASYSDCIMIILESSGAIAELGAFALSEDMAKKVLIVNNEEFKSSNSFINKGPIEKIEMLSGYKKCIWSNYREIATSFSEIKHRFEATLYKERSYNYFKIKRQPSFYKNLPNKEKLLFLADLIKIFEPIKKAELAGLIAGFFKITSFIDIETEIGLLNATGIIANGQEEKQYFMRSKERNRYFLKYDPGIEKIKCDVLNYYAKSSKVRMRLLEENL